MKTLNIKSIVIAAALTLSCAATSAQDLTSYYMPNAVVTQQHNAAFAPDRGYFNIPLVGNMAFSTNGNVAMSDLLYPVNGSLTSLFDDSVSSAVALSGLHSTNTFGLENRLGILGFGKYTKDMKSFWSFNIDLRSSFNFSMPYEMFELLKKAPAQSTINDVNIYMESYAEVAFGYTKPINEKLTVGGRGKLLFGLMNADLNIDQMDVTMNADEWKVDANGTLDLNANGMYPETKVDGNGVETYEMGDIEGSLSGLSGFGLAVDFGATYDYTDRLQFSLAVNDLGFIKWSEGANTSATVANKFLFTGTQYNASTGELTGADDIEFDDIVLEAQKSSGSATWLQASFNAGAEYDFFDHRLGVGAIYSAKLWRTKTVHNFATVATYTPLNWFSVAASYSLTSNDSDTVGLALNFATGFINLYMATDVLFSKKSVQYLPIDQTMMNFTFGMAVPLGKRVERD